LGEEKKYIYIEIIFALITALLQKKCARNMRKLISKNEDVLPRPRPIVAKLSRLYKKLSNSRMSSEARRSA
jgi:hypothetical protein